MKIKLTKFVEHKTQDMVEYINNLKDFNLVSNFVLVRPDPAYNVIVLKGPEGTKVELKLISTGEQEANHFSISGTVVKRPETLFYFDKASDEAMGMNQREFASSVKSSMSIKCEHEYKEGDKIYYNYNVQLQCEEENRLIETEEHGVCMIIPADQIFCYMDGEEMIPVNGYVFFERDKEPSEYQTDSGLTIIRNVKGYEKHSATVISSSTPVKAYLDGGVVTNETYKKGDRIIVDRRFGYKMAYDLHAEKLKNVETALQKHIIAKLEEVEA